MVTGNPNVEDELVMGSSLNPFGVLHGDVRTLVTVKARVIVTTKRNLSTPLSQRPTSSVFYPLFLSQLAACTSTPKISSRPLPTLSKNNVVSDSYFTKCLSCTLQKAVAQAFKTRITNVNRSKNCARSVVESDEFVFINNFVDGREYISQQ